MAAQNGHTEVVQLLIDKGSDVNQGLIKLEQRLYGLQHNGVIQQQHNY